MRLGLLNQGSFFAAAAESGNLFSAGVRNRLLVDMFESGLNAGISQYARETTAAVSAGATRYLSASPSTGQPSVAIVIIDGSGNLRFMPASGSGVELNKAIGDAWERDVIQNVLPQTQTAIQSQITIISGGPSDLRVRLDAIGTDMLTGLFRLTDSKASLAAPLTPNQIIVYPELEVFGGTVVGKGKPPYVGGTVIPPTKVDIIRKP
jgi:filamentous hemagglutinin